MLSSGCGLYLGPGLANSVEHLESPAYYDEDTDANYISVKAGNGNYFEEDDRNFHTTFSFHRANTYKNISVTYGGFGYLGNYRLGSDFDSLDFTGSKSYGGVGLIGGLNLQVPYKRVDWEILKFTTRIYNELGAYPRFKRELIAAEQPSGFNDLYVNHWRIIDMALGTGLKIKHENMGVTHISTGINWHAFAKSCNDSGRCEFGGEGMGGLNFQFGYSSPERFSLNFRLATGTIYDGWLFGEIHPIISLGGSYRL